MNNQISPAMGQWKNAPLVFVLAQVRFLAAAGCSAEHVRDAVAKRSAGRRFTVIKPHTTLNITMDAGAQPPALNPVQLATGYDLSCESLDTMLRVTKDSVSYATTVYKDSAAFLAEWRDLLGALGDMGVQTALRLGMRYVDFVLPSSGKRPEDYVVAPWNLHGLPDLPGADQDPSMAHSHVLDLPYPRGRMRLQFMRGYGVPQLAADLQGMLPPLTQAPAESLVCGVLDFDRWIDVSIPADIDTLGNGFAEIRGNLSQAFKAMITPLARAEWDPQGT